jgi:hypothetical protein
MVFSIVVQGRMAAGRAVGLNMIAQSFARKTAIARSIRLACPLGQSSAKKMTPQSLAFQKLAAERPMIVQDVDAKMPSSPVVFWYDTAIIYESKRKSKWPVQLDDDAYSITSTGNHDRAVRARSGSRRRRRNPWR